MKCFADVLELLERLGEAEPRILVQDPSDGVHAWEDVVAVDHRRRLLERKRAHPLRHCPDGRWKRWIGGCGSDSGRRQPTQHSGQRADFQFAADDQ